MSEKMEIQWYPGHMAKTRKLMAACIKQVDIVVELTDARIPASSRNPEVDRLIGARPRMLILNKSDFADPNATARWRAYYKGKGLSAVACDCRSGRGVNLVLPAAREVLADKLAALAQKGMGGRPVRMMVVGIPNVGKSSLINRMAGGKHAAVEDRPGVTLGKQWVSLPGGAELLDMPGVLWPKFDDKSVGEKLAFVGSVKDEILDVETLAARLLDTLRPDYAALLAARYHLEEAEARETPGPELLERIAKKRGMLVSGGEADTERAAVMLLDEFRGGVLGRITLEEPV